MSPKPLGERINDALKRTTVEPFLFFIMFGFNVRLITIQSLFHDRACRVSLNYSADICKDLDQEDHSDEQAEAITYGNNLNAASVVISTLPALVLASFVGPWSDRYNRKYPLLMATTGVLIDSIFQAVITSIETASPMWFLASSTISGFSGGLVIVISQTYSYMSDVTDERSRQTRYAVLEFFTILATPLGAYIGGQIYDRSGYLAVMIVGPISFSMAWLYARLCILETKPRRFDITKKQMLEDVFQVHNVRESIKTCAQPRPGNLRLQIWLLLFISFSIRLAHMGSLFIGFSYTRRTFKWKVTRYSYTTTLFSLLNAFATIVIVPILNKRLLLHEAAVGLVGVMSLMTKMVLMSVSVHEGLIFYAWISGTLYACGGIAIRSRMSKLVSKQELGKVFSLLATVESLSPVLGTISMMQIYNASVRFYPGLPFAVAAVFLIPAALVFAWMMKLPTMSYTEYQESEQTKTMKELKEVAAGNME